LPLAIVAILLFGIVGAVLLRVGADEKPHSILLKWDPPAPKPGVTVTGYNVYRSQPDGTFAPLASVTAPTYLDDKVSNRTTYHYFVRAVNSAGEESPPSNQASATIP
jgi:fibronectin type 3 domain-containing protein